jgi:hypothetical protein
MVDPKSLSLLQETNSAAAITTKAALTVLNLNFMRAKIIFLTT